MKSYRYSIYLFLLFLLVWQLAAHFSRIYYLLGDPLSIAQVLLQDTLNGTLPRDAVITGKEALFGFFIGVTFGTTCGFLLWYSPALAALSRPYVLALGALPIFSFAPLVIVWFGIGFSMKVAVSALGVGLLALSQAYEGARHFHIEQQRLFEMLGATRFQMLVKAVIPSSIDWVFSSMRLCVSTAILGAFIGEFISSNEGVGHYMNSHGALYDVPSVFAGGVYLIALSALLHLAIRLIAQRKRRLLRWLSISREFRNGLKRSPIVP